LDKGGSPWGGGKKPIFDTKVGGAHRRSTVSKKDESSDANKKGEKKKKEKEKLGWECHSLDLCWTKGKASGFASRKKGERGKGKSSSPNSRGRWPN